MSPGTSPFPSLTTFLSEQAFCLTLVLMISKWLTHCQKAGIQSGKSEERPVLGNPRQGSVGNRLQGGGSLLPETVSGSVVRKKTLPGPASPDHYIFLWKILCTCLLQFLERNKNSISKNKYMSFVHVFVQAVLCLLSQYSAVYGSNVKRQTCQKCLGQLNFE